MADDDKEFDDGMGPFDVALMLLPLVLLLLMLLFAEVEPIKIAELRKRLAQMDTEAGSRSYLFPRIVVVVVVLEFAFDFAAKRRKIRALGENSD